MLRAAMGAPADQIRDQHSGMPVRPNARPALASQAGSKLIYGLAIFASAFLLFQVQPMVAKIILPWFGGAAAVWIVCLLFFQVVLLFGYAYAHWLTTQIRAASQPRIHGALL